MNEQQVIKRLSAFRSKKNFLFLSKLRNTFPEAELFLVGGMVRDLLLSRESKDYDFVVRNVPAKKLLLELKKFGSVNLVGKTFGVIKFIPNNSKLTEPIDIALPRTDHAFGSGGYKDVEVQSDPRLPIEKDLERRDFTVNAIAFNLGTKRLIDPYNGIKNLKSKQLTTVGDPIERFHEDFTRILRCIRFACQLGFSIEKKTYLSIPKLVHHLTEKREKIFIVPREIIAQELIKSFVSNPVKAFDLLEETQTAKTLMPELLKMKGCPQPTNFHTEGDVWKHTRLALQQFGTSEYIKCFGKEKPTAEVIFASLFHDLGKPYTIQTPEKDGSDRIRFNDHDAAGAKVSLTIMKRLAFSVFPKSNTLLHVDPEKVFWIIRHHLAGHRNDIDAMRETTVEKYFLSENYPSQSLLRVQFADAAATLHKNGKPDFTSFQKVLKRIEQIKKKSKTKKSVPKRLVSGHDIMKHGKITPGPKVGQMIDEIREAQLAGKISTKKQAIAFLQKRASQR